MSRFWHGKPFPYRANSLNLTRLILASAVLVAHAWYITGTGSGPGWKEENLGGWAVAGFFVVSGFLITRSRLSHGLGDYLVHRLARIMPAFVVCLVLTAVLFGPIAALHEQGTLSGYLSTAPSPFSYVWTNLDLHVDQYAIGSTLTTVPYPSTWNGSIWTLYYEFCCYLVVGLLATFALVRRSVLPMAFAFVVSVAAYAGLDTLQRYGANEDLSLLARLLPFFLGGAVVHYVIDRYGIATVPGALALPVALGLIALGPVGTAQATAPLLAYGILWLSTVVPQPALIARNDVSYGVYIYAWPVQQLVELLGPTAGQLWPSIVLSTAITAVLGTLSWLFVERPVMRRVKRRDPDPVPAVGPPATS